MEIFCAFKSDLSGFDLQACHLVVMGLGSVTNMLSFSWLVCRNGTLPTLEEPLKYYKPMCVSV